VEARHVQVAPNKWGAPEAHQHTRLVPALCHHLGEVYKNSSSNSGRRTACCCQEGGRTRILLGHQTRHALRHLLYKNIIQHQQQQQQQQQNTRTRQCVLEPTKGGPQKPTGIPDSAVHSVTTCIEVITAAAAVVLQDNCRHPAQRRRHFKTMPTLLTHSAST
jgi:hypothetical protein